MTRLLEDIARQPGELLKTLEYTTGDGCSALQAAAQLIRGAEHVFITGIGSSWHAGMTVQSLLQRQGIAAQLHDASELLHFVPIPTKTVVIALSRSGKSVEIVELLAKAKSAEAKVIAITNTPESPLAAQADAVLFLRAAFDHNISITMYSALTLVGGLLAAEFCEFRGAPLNAAIVAGLHAGDSARAGWQKQIEASHWLEGESTTYFLARGASFASASETRLLWEEAAKCGATALTTGGFRHGSQELIYPGVRIGLWIGAEVLRAQDIALARDLAHQGARVLLIGQGLADEETGAELVLQIPAIPAPWRFLLDIMPAQLLSENFARRRGVDCDSFRYCPYIIATEGGL